MTGAGLTCVSEVLIAIGDIGGDHAYHDPLVLKVVAQLADPVEVSCRADFVLM